MIRSASLHWEWLAVAMLGLLCAGVLAGWSWFDSSSTPSGATIITEHRFQSASAATKALGEDCTGSGASE